MQAEKILNDRIKILKTQIDNLKAGKGVCMVSPEVQLKKWQQEVAKAEKKLAELGTK